MALASELAPGFLLAAPRLRDPNFKKTVVLLGRHDAEGALGWIVNGRAIASVVELFKTSGLFEEKMRFPAGGGFARAACQGGPVAPATGWLLFKPVGDELPGQLDLSPELAVTGEASAFPAFLGEDGPRDFRLVLGCAGWAPGQLEAEIGEGSWLPAALDVNLLFDLEGDEAWDEAYRRSVGAAPAVFTGKPAKA